ncbi:substrate-binding domain-containing protein [Halarcobacter bivalviorum]|uniref:Autoinducer-2 (AI-2) receptor LuxPQ, periplasmic binding protein LuxP n=1 Tax=Halarcobacter bivalviorum TaxID=663364 RepID=A0AAX2A670_9BACT|nr:substrate-binding domain-containing protein [Halarcobacter bivalviorum]AXH11323.1 autoinducer-2 (AI-2) receptor LuxPQ, periplasmic binding protein LuxP [Halarcobacter bivalviorum]RXK09588.1 sugar ABC transporter substrate-binding protein [Halarcobacter bivalviorum]
MKYLLTFTLLFLFSLNLYAVDEEYFQVREFLKTTNQEDKYNEFNKIIKQDAQALKKKNKKIKIVLVYPANQISDYWRKNKISFEKRLKELKIDYELIDFFTKPAVEIKEQSKHLMKALKENPDYLIFTLDAKKHKKFVERIVSKKKTKLILQNITTPLKEWQNRQPFIYIGFDHYKGTKLLADYYIKETKGEGNYAVLYGSKGYVSYMRGTRFVEYLNENSKLKLTHEYYTDVNKEKAKLATLDLLSRDSNLKFIYACSTDIAFGVIEALKEKNLLGQIKVNGWGGGSNELTAIENNLLDITVMRMSDDSGVAMAEAIKLDITNQAYKVPTIYSGEFAIVEKGIEQVELEKLKNRAFRYTKDD